MSSLQSPWIRRAHQLETELESVKAENKRLRELLISHLINPDEGKEP